jgi:hypothetical protein
MLKTNIAHTFSFVTTASMTTLHSIFIVYPVNFQGVMPNDCTHTDYYCFVFPKRRWVMLCPKATVSAGNIVISINMNNAYYSQDINQYFKITIARGVSTQGQTYNVLQPPFTTLKVSPTSVAVSMSISATQTPNIYLRNYANTAIFLLDNIFIDNRINAIYIKASSDVTSWDSTYCNASLTNTMNDLYPYRFICEVAAEDSTFLRITRDS